MRMRGGMHSVYGRGRKNANENEVAKREARKRALRECDGRVWMTKHITEGIGAQSRKSNNMTVRAFSPSLVSGIFSPSMTFMPWQNITEG